MGETAVTLQADSGNGNLLVAQSAVLSQTATIQSLSFYVTTASGNLRLGIYDATGPGGGPGARKAETNSFTPVTGWNTANVITPVSLPAGTFGYLLDFPILVQKQNFKTRLELTWRENYEFENNFQLCFIFTSSYR